MIETVPTTETPTAEAEGVAPPAVPGSLSATPPSHEVTDQAPRDVEPPVRPQALEHAGVGHADAEPSSARASGAPQVDEDETDEDDHGDVGPEPSDLDGEDEVPRPVDEEIGVGDEDEAGDDDDEEDEEGDEGPDDLDDDEADEEDEDEDGDLPADEDDEDEDENEDEAIVDDDDDEEDEAEARAGVADIASALTDAAHADPDGTGDSQPDAVEPSGFAALGLSEPILRAVAEMGYVTPTPVQAQAIPFVLMGRDVLGCAQTGTGKTAGFTLPMLDILSGSRARARMPRSLILEPTRELALQVAENFVKYGKHLKLTHALIIGGDSMSDQRDVLTRGVDVLIATPGRLIDMFERGLMLLTDCRVLVIDEADRMLDMGFIPDVERIVSLLPRNRQTLFFSATMAPEIRKLADAFLQNPKEITVAAPASVATTITTGLALVAEQDKREALRRLIRSEEVQNALIFCNRKRDVDILYKSLTRHGFSVGSLHGDMAQPVRFATLEKFKNNELRLLCCSDVAARGIDIGGLSHVFNFDVPIHAEDYVHRIGRTGRAGREGRAFTLATPEDRPFVEAIEKLTGRPIPRLEIPGLDVVTWAESDGRRRRGRGGKGKGGKHDRSDQKRGAETGRERGRHESRQAEPARHEAARTEPARHEPARTDHGRPARPDRDRAAGHAQPIVMREPPRGDRERERDRDRGRRGDNDLGPAVVGFGADIPAFMLIPARSRRHTVETAHNEDTEFDA